MTPTIAILRAASASASDGPCTRELLGRAADELERLTGIVDGLNQLLNAAAEEFGCKIAEVVLRKTESGRVEIEPRRAAESDGIADGDDLAEAVGEAMRWYG